MASIAEPHIWPPFDRVAKTGARVNSTQKLGKRLTWNICLKQNDASEKSII
jgi:hypothetical protein